MKARYLNLKGNVFDIEYNYIIYVIKYKSLIINRLQYEKSKNYKDL